MLEKSTKVIKDAKQIAEKTIQARRWYPEQLEEGSIPNDCGVYIWRDKKTEEVIYIGRALGKNGLRQRLRQHLRPSYTKSVLRKKVASEHRLDIRERCVKHICQNFTVAYLPCSEADSIAIRLAELFLIAEYRPKYNSEANVD